MHMLPRRMSFMEICYTHVSSSRCQHYSWKCRVIYRMISRQMWVISESQWFLSLVLYYCANIYWCFIFLHHLFLEIVQLRTFLCRCTAVQQFVKMSFKSWNYTFSIPVLAAIINIIYIHGVKQHVAERGIIISTLLRQLVYDGNMAYRSVPRCQTLLAWFVFIECLTFYINIPYVFLHTFL